MVPRTIPIQLDADDSGQASRKRRHALRVPGRHQHGAFADPRNHCRKSFPMRRISCSQAQVNHIHAVDETPLDRAQEHVDSSPSLIVTALAPHIGYAKAAALVKRALAERRPLLDVALEEKVLPEADLKRVLDPLPMTKGGVQS